MRTIILVIFAVCMAGTWIGCEKESTEACAELIQIDCKLRVVSKDKWSYENEGTVYRFYTVNEIYVDAEVYRDAVIGECIDTDKDPDYCAHPRVIGYINEDLNLIKYDFSLCD